MCEARNIIPYLNMQTSLHWREGNQPKQPFWCHLSYCKINKKWAKSHFLKLSNDSYDNAVAEGACHRLAHSPSFIDGATLSRKCPVWVLWIHRGLSLQSTVKYCSVMNRLSSAMVKGPATTVVNLWIKLFCCLQAWMETASSVCDVDFMSIFWLPLWDTCDRIELGKHFCEIQIRYGDPVIQSESFHSLYRIYFGWIFKKKIK